MQELARRSTAPGASRSAWATPSACGSTSRASSARTAGRQGARAAASGSRSSTCWSSRSRGPGQALHGRPTVQRSPARPRADHGALRASVDPSRTRRATSRLGRHATARRPTRSGRSSPGCSSAISTPARTRAASGAITSEGGRQVPVRRHLHGRCRRVEGQDPADGHHGRRARLSSIGSPERVLEPEWTYRADTRARIFSVQLAELTDDGVSVRRGEPLSIRIQAILINSLILTTKDRKAVVVVEDVTRSCWPWTSTGDGVKKMLWAQSFVETASSSRAMPTACAPERPAGDRRPGPGAEHLPGDGRDLQQHLGQGHAGAGLRRRVQPPADHGRQPRTRSVPRRRSAAA